MPVKKKRPQVVRKKSAVQSNVNSAFDAWKMQTEARARLARSIYDEQDNETKEAIDRIRDRLLIHASGLYRVNSDGGYIGIKERGQSDWHAVQVDRTYIEWNCLYQAVEIVKDLALVDIRVGKFHFPENLCAQCGKKRKSNG